MNTNRLPPVALAVNHWLAFQRLVGRECLFSEEYLSQSIAEYLIHHHSGGLIPEDDHPIFKNAKPGRPRQIDYALTHESTGKRNILIECKWIGKKTDNQRILNDLLRLEAIAGIKGREPKCYMLVAGLLEDFQRNFHESAMNAGAGRMLFAQTLFNSPATKPKPYKVEIKSCHAAFRKLYKNFIADYSVKLPNCFYTTLVARTIDNGIAVYIWRIKPMDRRITFVPTW